jgi:hypothetical protein
MVDWRASEEVNQGVKQDPQALSCSVHENEVTSFNLLSGFQV